MTESAKTPRTPTSKDKKWFHNGPKERFLCLPITAVLDRRLKLESLKVLMALALHADDDGKCFPGRDLLAGLTGMHPVNVSKATSKLVHLGWITKRPRYKQSSIYYLSVPDDLITVPDASGEVDAFLRENRFEIEE